MAMLPVILGFGQKCPNCRQRSSPKVGQGTWEIMGVWNGAIHRCTDCGTLVRIGFLAVEALSQAESRRFLSARDKHLSE